MDSAPSNKTECVIVTYKMSLAISYILVYGKKDKNGLIVVLPSQPVRYTKVWILRAGRLNSSPVETIRRHGPSCIWNSFAAAGKMLIKETCTALINR